MSQAFTENALTICFSLKTLNKRKIINICSLNHLNIGIDRRYIISVNSLLLFYDFEHSAIIAYYIYFISGFEVVHIQRTHFVNGALHINPRENSQSEDLTGLRIGPLFPLSPPWNCWPECWLVISIFKVAIVLKLLQIVSSRQCLAEDLVESFQESPILVHQYLFKKLLTNQISIK